MAKTWTDELLATAVAMASTCDSVGELADKLSNETGKRISKDAVKSAFCRYGLVTSDYIGCAPLPRDDVATPGVDEPDHMAVVRAVQRGSKTLEQLADTLGVPPGTARKLVAGAVEAGYAVSIKDDAASFDAKMTRPPATAKASVREGPDGGFKFALIGDIHYCSDSCAEAELLEFLEYAYDWAQGDLLVLNAGDLLHGELNHRGFKYETKVIGFEKQVKKLLAFWPRKPGMRMHWIDGNHETNSWGRAIGMTPGRHVQYMARDAGRDDLTYLGYPEANVLFGSDPDTQIKVLLSHKKMGPAYAMSYKPQKAAETTWRDKPHLACYGHMHKRSWFPHQGIEILQPGAFQWLDKRGREMGYDPMIGGWLIHMRREGRRVWINPTWKGFDAPAADWTVVA